MTDDDRLGPPPVEPMSEAAWSRVERGIWSRLGDAPAAVERARSRRWWIAAPVVAAAAAVALVIALRPGAPDSDGDDLRLVTDAAGSSVSFADSHLEVAPYTALAASRRGGHPVVLLERGASWFSVAPRGERPDFVVRAGDAVVRVVGTRFRVARSGEQVEVEVERGVVDVQFRGSVIAVGANQRWSSTSPAALSRLASRAPATAAAPPSEPTVDLPAAPAPAAPPASPHAPVAPRRDARPADVAAPESKHDPSDTSGAVGAPRTGDDLERAEYERLAALEPTHPDAARDGYLALARGTSRWADLALFAAARLAVDRHDRNAETLLRIYLQRFPGGANAADAKQLLVHLKGERP